MYISYSKYGHREHIHFQIDPDREIYYTGYVLWKSKYGYRIRITYYTDWGKRWPQYITYWSRTRKGARRKVAKWLYNNLKADRKYLEYKESSR